MSDADLSWENVMKRCFFLFHDWQFITNVTDVEIGRRSLWRCSKCPAEQYRAMVN
ncbi:MAG: hypothetical protein ACEQSB_04140 [Undibacterium sp.]